MGVNYYRVSWRRLQRTQHPFRRILSRSLIRKYMKVVFSQYILYKVHAVCTSIAKRFLTALRYDVLRSGVLNFMVVALALRVCGYQSKGKHTKCTSVVCMYS